ncbi:TIR domain-containing protein [Streptomyces sp. MST-110588]|uniref:toll/interleukin-1 receptor domain-containing protein n=1 Tax=Streptomyces sp. MST-110588 TaxID=2833628 RepID=UPI001F5DE700|nr:TIR domain-containing protein [Streptomyces sp. MST-110588]UNO43581.1 TIR domain-containing protein [Streptomyces sp. MST-110588]
MRRVRRRQSGTSPPAESAERFTYDAFLSYSRTPDRELALALQQGLHAFAKPWYRLRALRVFRDEGSLGAGPRLWDSIRRALDSSRFLVLLACEHSARAPWVQREVEYWCAHRGVENVLIVLTDPPADGGEALPGMAWDALRGDFDWRRTTALPGCLAGRFQEEPHAVLLGWARARQELSLRDPDFRMVVAELASPLHGVDKDGLIGEDVRQHRRTRRRVRLTIAVLAALALVAASAAVTAVRQRDTARQQTALAEVRQYVAEARGAADPYTALAFAVAAEQRITPALPEARAAFGEAVLKLDSWGARPVGEASLERLDPDRLYDASVRWSGDGSQAWLADADGNVARWSVRDSRTVLPLRKTAAPVAGSLAPDSVHWSRDGRSLLMTLHGPSDGLPRWYLVREALSGRVTAGPFALRPAGDGVHGVALSPRGDVLASVSEKGGIEWWQVGSGHRLGGPLPGSPGDISNLTWSPDGGRLAAVGGRGLLVWDMRRGTLLWSAPAKHRVKALDWSPDGRRIVTGDEKGMVQRWDTRKGTASPAFGQETQGDAISEVRWSPDGARIAVTDTAGTLRLWDPAAGTAVGPALASDRNHALASLAWSPDSRFLLGRLEHADRPRDHNEPHSAVLRLWEVQPPTARHRTLHGPTGSVLALSWSPDDRRIAGGSSDETVWIWDSRTREPLPGSPFRQSAPAGVPIDGVNSIVWDPGGRRLLRVGNHGLRIWPVSGGAGASPPPWWGSGGAVTAAWSPDGSRVASGTDGGEVRVWDAATGRLTPRQPRHVTAVGRAGASAVTAAVRSVAWSPDNRRLAAALADGSLHFWDAASGRPLGPAPRISPHLARAMAWSPDGELIATGGVDGTIRLWDGRTGEQSPTILKEGDSWIQALAWSPDSTRLVSGDGNGTMRVWDPRRGVPLQRRGGAHSAGVTALSWSPDGSRLVSGGEDHVVRLWQGRTEREICRLVDQALHRTRTTPALTGATDIATDACAHPSRIHNYPVLPLLSASGK